MASYISYIVPRGLEYLGACIPEGFTYVIHMKVNGLQWQRQSGRNYIPAMDSFYIVL
jgi:hypothetical protein